MAQKTSGLARHALVAIAVIVAVGAVPSVQGDDGAYVGNAAPYAASDLRHAFDMLNVFVTVGADHHLIVNETAADLHPDITRLDVIIAYDFAVHSDAIIDAMNEGPVGNVNELDSMNPKLLAAITDLENGKFSRLFGQDGSEIHTTSFGTVPPIVYSKYTGVQNIDVFGTSNAIPVYHGNYGPICVGSCSTVCGGGFFDHHKPKMIETFPFRFTYINAARDHLEGSGYHQVAFLATSNHMNDYAKIASDYGCIFGEFRDQAVIKSAGVKYRITTQGPEVNPEIAAYTWPAPWWGAYVAVWHAIY